MAICFVVDRHSYLKGEKMGLPKIWESTLERLDYLEKSVASILSFLHSSNFQPKLEPDPEPEPEPEKEKEQ